MSLQDQLEEDRKKLAEMLESETKEDEEEEIEETEEEEPEPEEESVEKEPEKEPEKPVEEPKLDASGYARLRREAAASKKLAEEERTARQALAEENERLKSGQYEPVEQSQEVALPPVLQKLIQREHTNEAISEFKNYEADFRGTVENYDSVADQYQTALAQSIKIQNPRMSRQDVDAQAQHIIMVKASEYLKSGLNPIEELYHDAIEAGYTGKQPEIVEKVKEIKPDLDRVAANRKRNSGFAAASGQGSGGQITLKHAATQYTNAEWMALEPSEKLRIMGGR